MPDSVVTIGVVLAAPAQSIVTAARASSRVAEQCHLLTTACPVWQEAFKDCSGLATATFGDSVTAIGEVRPAPTPSSVPACYCYHCWYLPGLGPLLVPLPVGIALTCCWSVPAGGLCWCWADVDRGAGQRRYYRRGACYARPALSPPREHLQCCRAVLSAYHRAFGAAVLIPKLSKTGDGHLWTQRHHHRRGTPYTDS